MGQMLAHLEYENLVTALNLALAAQGSILYLYLALTQYIDTTQDQAHGLELGQTVLSRLEAYPVEKLTGRLGLEFASVIDGIANRQLQLKQYAQAGASYQKALAILLNNKGSDAATIQKLSASIYHQLGMVAQEQHQWTQAEQYYQHALQIYVKYNDRYAQASIYNNLGVVAEEQRQWQQAREYFLQALEIFVEYKDTYSGDVVLRSLARLWKASGDANLPTSVATTLGYSVEETEKLLREMLGEE